MNVLTNITGTPNTANFPNPAQQVTVGDFTNPNFPRGIQLTNNGLIVFRPGITAGFPFHDLIIAAVNLEPNLTWVPIISVQPVNVSVTAPTAASFNIAASCENGVTLNYQWQISNDNGSTWNNQADTGPYTNSTTNHLNISNSTGLNGKYYRCRPYNVAGTTNSNAGVLLVT